jgi:hydroxysqualene dehydroxylase
MHDVIIFGGGLSGLSAAVELSALGRSVLVLEQHRHCGGRTFSFRDAASGSIVDNGQHLMMGCYHGTRQLLGLIGTDHLATLQPALRIEYLSPQQQHLLACARIPAPFHLLGGLLRFTSLSMKDRVLMLRVVKELMSTSPEKETDLDRMTVEEWLRQLGQTELSRKFLWDVITVGALNNHPKDVSALMFFRVLRAAFLGKNEHASLLIPRVGLSELFVDPAVQFIRGHGGDVLTGVHVEKMILDGNHVRSIWTTDGREFQAPSFVSAIPWYAFGELLKRSKIQLKQNRRVHPNTTAQERYQSSPIISIHLWIDRRITDLDFAAMLETRIQWVFNKSSMMYGEHEKRNDRQYLSLVISGAQEYIGLHKKQLVELAMEDVRQVLPKAQKAQVVHALVIKEKRATFLPSPGLEPLRPNARTKFENLFLAGDWTSTGFPATIEGAVISGRTVAQLIR